MNALSLIAGLALLGSDVIPQVDPRDPTAALFSTDWRTRNEAARLVAESNEDLEFELLGIATGRTVGAYQEPRRVPISSPREQPRSRTSWARTTWELEKTPERLLAVSASPWRPTERSLVTTPSLWVPWSTRELALWALRERAERSRALKVTLSQILTERSKHGGIRALVSDIAVKLFPVTPGVMGRRQLVVRARGRDSTLLTWAEFRRASDRGQLLLRLITERPHASWIATAFVEPTDLQDPDLQVQLAEYWLDDDERHRPLVHLLGSLGERASPALLECLEQACQAKSAAVRRRAVALATMLGSVSARLAPALKRLACDEHSSTRHWARHGLGRLGARIETTDAIASRLIADASSNNYTTRQTAFYTLGHARFEDREPAVRALENGLCTATDSLERDLCLVGICNQGAADRIPIETILEAVQPDEEWKLRRHAVLALAIGGRIDTLRELVLQPDHRRLVTDALANLADLEIANALAPWLLAEEPELSQAAVSIIAGPWIHTAEDFEAAVALIEASSVLSDPTLREIYASRIAWSSCRSPARLRQLEALARDDEAAVRRTALAGMLSDESTRPSLESCIESITTEPPRIAELACEALSGQTLDAGCRRRLSRAMEAAGSDRLRLAMLEVLVQQTPLDANVLTRLGRMLEVGSSRQRIEVCAILAKACDRLDDVRALLEPQLARKSVWPHHDYHAAWNALADLDLRVGPASKRPR